MSYGRRVFQMALGLVMCTAMVYEGFHGQSLAWMVILGGLGAANIAGSVMAHDTRKESGPDEW